MILELRPMNGQKSFYGKATVSQSSNGTEHVYILRSYSTDMLRKHVSMEEVKYFKLSDYWSNTTLRHINSFIYPHKLSKKEWDKIPLNTYITLGTEFPWQQNI